MSKTLPELRIRFGINRGSRNGGRLVRAKYGFVFSKITGFKIQTCSFYEDDSTIDISGYIFYFTIRVWGIVYCSER